jgi:hypothetical protein
LRIGDALDADARRINKDFLEQHRFETIPAKGQFHLLKHACTASIERIGVGDFKFHYTFPPDVDKLQPAVQRASEKYLREHLRDARELLNKNRIALMTISSEINNKNMSFPYPFADAVRKEFRAFMAGEIAGGPPQDPTRYLEWLHDNTSHINIRGLAVGSGKAHRFPIEDLYIPLTTSLGGERGPKPGASPECAGAEETAHPELHKALRERTLVIVGDPGAGKSTFLNRITAALCDAWLGHDPQAAEKRLGLKERPLPALIRVGELAEHIETCRKPNQGPTYGLRASSWLAHFLAAFGTDHHWKLDEAYFLGSSPWRVGEWRGISDGWKHAGEYLQT